MERSLDQIFNLERPALYPMVENNNNFQRDWLNPFLRFCHDHGLEIKLFNVHKIEKYFVKGAVPTWHHIMSRRPQSENELRLLEFDSFLLQHHRLHELCKQYPSQKYKTLIGTLNNRQVHLQKEKLAIFTQEYGNMFEINWSKTQISTEYLWKVAVYHGSKYIPRNIQKMFRKSDSTVYFCKPFGDFLINELGGMKDNGLMVRKHSNGEAMLLDNSEVKLGGRPMLSILSLEVQNQLTSSTLTFLDIENGVAMWIKASSKTTKPLFFVPQLKQNCII